MKKIINNILHRWKEDSLTKNNEMAVREPRFYSKNEIRTGLIFWVADPEQEVWLNKVTSLLKEVKFHRLCYVPVGVKVEERLNIVTMRNEDLNFGGKIENYGLHELLEKQYDLLIDLSGISNGLVNYVLSNTQASCIVGMKKEGGIADIIIDDVVGPEDFIDKLIELLEKIKSY